MAITGDGEKLYLRALDMNDRSGNNYSKELGETEKNFAAVFRAEYLEKLLPVDYNVSVSAKGFAYFKGEDVEYYVTLEAKSSKF